MIKTIKAYKVTLDGVRCVVFSESRSKAKYAVFKSAIEAGFGYKLNDLKISCLRAKKFDGLPLKEGWCYSFDYLEKLVKDENVTR